MQTNKCFPDALTALKDGKTIARAGWNGKNMKLWLKKGGVAPDKPLDANGQTYEGIASGLFEPIGEGTISRLPCICMQVATGSILEGWLASQTDMLAEDWCILEDEEAAS